MSDGRVLIVGAGHAGVHTAACLVDAGWPGEITLLDAFGGVPYERPPLSKSVLSSESPTAPPLRRSGYYRDKGIDLIQGRATGIDRAARSVVLESGQRLDYAKLVLATGARPRRWSVPGADHPRVAVLRTVADAVRVRAALAAGSRIVIVGAGYVGLEVAAAATRSGCHVVILELADRVMSRVTSPPVSRFFQRLHRDHGAILRLGVRVDRVVDNGDAVDVVCDTGRAERADLVVAGIGIEPDVALAAEAGLACSDGVLVDSRSMTSDPDIYAVGDMTRFTCPRENVSQRLECVQNAIDQAEAAARDLTGRPAAAAGVPWFWTVQHDARLQTAGVWSADDEVVVRGDQDDAKFSVLYLRDGRLAAIDTVNSLKDFTQGKRLIAERSRIDVGRAADPSNALKACALTPGDGAATRSRVRERVS